MPVTAFTFSAPARCSRRNTSARASGDSSAPSPSRLTWAFWHARQRSVQPVKNTVPEPPLPVTGGSSPKCRHAQAARTTAVSPQTPVSPRAAVDRAGAGAQEAGGVGIGAHADGPAQEDSSSRMRSRRRAASS